MAASYRESCGAIFRDADVDLRAFWVPASDGYVIWEHGDMQAGYVTAYRDQLGLKLKRSKAAVQFLVIDHVEEPSPN